MFLDEKLLQKCKDVEITDSQQLIDLKNEICKECEDYYKSKLSVYLSDKEIKTVMDKTFNLFDSFVRMALKSEDKKVVILGEMFSKHTFKEQWLSNEDMYEIYNNL